MSYNNIYMNDIIDLDNIDSQDTKQKKHDIDVINDTSPANIYCSTTESTVISCPKIIELSNLNVNSEINTSEPIVINELEQDIIRNERHIDVSITNLKNKQHSVSECHMVQPYMDKQFELLNEARSLPDKSTKLLDVVSECLSRKSVNENKLWKSDDTNSCISKISSNKKNTWVSSKGGFSTPTMIFSLGLLPYIAVLSLPLIILITIVALSVTPLLGISPIFLLVKYVRSYISRLSVIPKNSNSIEYCDTESTVASSCHKGNKTLKQDINDITLLHDSSHGISPLLAIITLLGLPIFCFCTVPFFLTIPFAMSLLFPFICFLPIVLICALPLLCFTTFICAIPISFYIPWSRVADKIKTQFL